MVKSAHDCSQGGLAVALAECCAGKEIGAKVKVEQNVRKDALLFGESQSRVILSCSKENSSKIIELCKADAVSVQEIGEVSGDKLIINELINVDVKKISDAWKGAIERFLKK